MKLKIEIELGNDAFGDNSSDRGNEVNRILRALAVYLHSRGIVSHDTGKLHDYNGNTVGTWKVTK